MRLIDADKLMRFFTIDTANQTYRFGTIKKQIENAETIQAIIIPKGATNGDIYELVFGKKVSKNSTNEWWNKKYEYNSN